MRSWSAYYKWLQQGKWSWVALGVQLAKLVVTSFPQPVWFLIFDDTFIYCSSRKAPDSWIYRQHGNKANRPQYARGQNWVTMALSIASGKKYTAIPLLSRLMRSGGNTGKLQAAKALLRVIAPVFADQEKKKTFCLADSWFMKWPFLKYVLESGFQVIGQVRKGTALYGIPIATCCRNQVVELINLTPWRKKNQVTAGRVRLGLQRILGNVRVRAWRNPTCRTFQLPNNTGSKQNRSSCPGKQEYMMSKNNMVEHNPPPSQRW